VLDLPSLHTQLCAGKSFQGAFQASVRQIEPGSGCIHSGLGSLQTSFTTLALHLKQLAIQPKERISRLNLISFRNQNFGDPPGDFGRQRHLNRLHAPGGC
jgi:hypothetical protein